MNDIGPAERFVAGTIGEPGSRTFYIEVVSAVGSYWFLCEKGQVAALGSRALELLSEASALPDPDVVDMLLGRADLGDPGEVEFRIGAMSLSIIEGGDLIAVELINIEDKDDGIMFVAAPEQIQAMGLKALETVGQGRPICQDCRLPMLEEHKCPARNGHTPH